MKNIFKLGQFKKLNGNYTIDLINKRIVAGSVYWTYETMEELIKAIEELLREIKESQ